MNGPPPVLLAAMEAASASLFLAAHVCSKVGGWLMQRSIELERKAESLSAVNLLR